MTLWRSALKWYFRSAYNQKWPIANYWKKCPAKSEAKNDVFFLPYKQLNWKSNNFAAFYLTALKFQSFNTLVYDVITKENQLDKAAKFCQIQIQELNK